jgi:hypothetical protein
VPSCARPLPPNLPPNPRKGIPAVIAQPLQARTGPDMTDEELAELRVYKPAEVAGMLNIPLTRLERWVREGKVLHLRAGALRGVEFTAEDIRRIGRSLPELMRRRGGLGVSAPEGEQTAAASAGLEPAAETIAGWALLRAHRPASRM